jgi:hypothetical protein
VGKLTNAGPPKPTNVKVLISNVVLPKYFELNDAGMPSKIMNM